MSDEYWNEFAKAAKKRERQMLSRIWHVGRSNRGLGRCDYAVLVVKTGEVVVECPNRSIAEHIVNTHNNQIKAKRWKATSKRKV